MKNRNIQAKADKKIHLNKQQQAALQKKRKKALIAACAVIILVVIIIIALALLKDGGVFMRAVSVSKTDNVKVDGAMMSYFFWDTFNYSIESNSQYYKLNGLASAEDLDSITPSGSTWREDFEELSVRSVDLYMNYAVYAYENGISLNDESYAEIDKTVTSMKNIAEVNGLTFSSYLASRYGIGVNENDLRNCLALEYLATAGYHAMTESLKPSEEEIREYYTENQTSLMMTDFYFFSIGISGKNELTEEQEEYYAGHAADIASAATADEFKEKVAKYLRELNNTYPLDSDERLSGDELTDYINETVSGLLREKVEYDDSIGLHSWIFNTERMPGDTTVNHSDDYGTYGIVYIVTPIYINEEWESVASSAIADSKLENALAELDEKYPVSSEKLVSQIAALK